MNTKILLAVFSVVAISSCTSMYKSGQTPDDVYYSPARPGGGGEYVQVEKEQERYQTYDEYAEAYRNDRFLRMGVRNRYRMNSFDEMDWYNMRYNNIYSYNSMWYDGFNNNPWNNNYYSWNNYYNPYCSYSCYNRYGANGMWMSKDNYRQPNNMRNYTFNSGSYRSSNRPRLASGNTYYNSGSGNNRYNNSNRVYTGSKRNSEGSNNSNTPSTNTYTPTRSYSPSSSGSSSGGNSSSGNSGGNNSGSGVKRPGGK